MYLEIFDNHEGFVKIDHKTLHKYFRYFFVISFLYTLWQDSVFNILDVGIDVLFAEDFEIDGGSNGHLKKARDGNRGSL